MRRAAIIGPIVLASATAGSAQYRTPYTPPAQPAYQQSSAVAVGYALNDWRRLRQSSGYSFGDYARFIISNPGWPQETTMRRWAERAMRPGEQPATVIAFFAARQPYTGGGYARLAEAQAAYNRSAEALRAAREAWASDDLSATDEQAIWARFGSQLTSADHDRRVDALLFAKNGDNAARFVGMTSPARRAAFAARVAMQARSPDAEALYGQVIGSVTSDAGLLMDRARWLRDNNYEDAARQLAARPRALTYRPADPERFYDMLILLAEGAYGDRQYRQAYNIARQLDDALPASIPVNASSLGVRDKYTELAWLAGTIALDRINEPASAALMFDRYANAGRSLQVKTKGYYWAGRAKLAAGRYGEATTYFQNAAAYPELFYGQLALERLGRAVPAPQPSVASYAATPAARAAFQANRLVQATRITGQQGRPEEQALFVRALAESLDDDAQRGLAIDLGQQIGRRDLAVWVARSARIKGSMFYVRQAFPTVSVQSENWTLAHGISRQESSFDTYAQSHVGAQGLMQLMPGTAREQAGKMGLAYDRSRLMTDENYNIMLGSGYFRRMLAMWDGNVPLAVASYNAGYGNVRKWVARYGDPRGNVDVLKWVEAIPFDETKSYVQRVIENSVVYDSLRGGGAQQTAMHVSRYLGKSRPG